MRVDVDLLQTNIQLFLVTVLGKKYGLFTPSDLNWLKISCLYPFLYLFWLWIVKIIYKLWRLSSVNYPVFLHWQILEHLKEIGQMTNMAWWSTSLVTVQCQSKHKESALPSPGWIRLLPYTITKSRWGHSRLLELFVGKFHFFLFFVFSKMM